MHVLTWRLWYLYWLCKNMSFWNFTNIGHVFDMLPIFLIHWWLTTKLVIMISIRLTIVTKSLIPQTEGMIIFFYKKENYLSICLGLPLESDHLYISQFLEVILSLLIIIVYKMTNQNIKVMFFFFFIHHPPNQILLETQSDSGLGFTRFLFLLSTDHNFKFKVSAKHFSFTGMISCRKCILWIITFDQKAIGCC